MLSSIQLWGVIIAAVLGFFVGAPWYSKLMFGRLWLQENGMTEEQCQAHNKMAYVYSLICSLIAAYVLALVLKAHPGFFNAVGFSLMIGAAWVATALCINDQFSNRSFKLFLIDAGYHIVRFLIYGIVLGIMI